MIVHSELEGTKSRSSYQLTLEKEDGVVSFYDEKRIDSILKTKKRLLKYSPYPAMVFLEKYSTAFLRKLGLKKKDNYQSFNK